MKLTSALLISLCSTILWVGCYDSQGRGSGVRLAVTDVAPQQMGDAFWVDVRLEGAESLATPLASVNFTLHYTNSHLRVVQHEPGAWARPEAYQANNYPSNAEMAFGMSIDSARGDGTAPTLARVQLRADDVTSDEAPAYLSISGGTAYDRAGNRLTFAAAPTRVVIQPVPGQGPVPTLRLFTQHAVQGRLTAKRVVLDRPGWIVVRTTGAAPGEVVATRWLPAGTHEDVTLAVDEAFGLAERQIARLQAMLHYDTGTPEQFEHGGEGTPDPPVRREEQVVAATFLAQYTDSEAESSIVVRNQQLANRRLHVDEVVASEPADLVIHRGRRDRPFIPGIIGKVRVPPGTTRNLDIPLFDDATVVCGETLWPMLHVRTESNNQPYEIDHPLVTEPATILCEDDAL